MEEWEHSHRFGRSSDRDYNRRATQRFGALKTAGLFPALENGDWLFPAPLDVVPSDDGVLRLLRPLRPDANGAKDNLPEALRYPLGNCCVPSKAKGTPWWSKAAFEAYLSGRQPEGPDMKGDGELMAGEWSTGIAIDPVTEITGRGEAEGRIYSAEYLRLRPGIQMGFVATLPKRNGSGTDVQECIVKLFKTNRSIIVGGQQKVCSVERLNNGKSLSEILPTSVEIRGNRVK